MKLPFWAVHRLLLHSKTELLVADKNWSKNETDNQMSKWKFYCRNSYDKSMSYKNSTTTWLSAGFDCDDIFSLKKGMNEDTG